MALESPAEQRVQVVNPAEATAADPVVNAAEATAAGAEDAKQPASILEAVQAAVAEDKAEPTSGSKESGEAKAEGEIEAKVGDTPAAVEKQPEEAPPPFHEHPRWKQMVKERQELSTKVTTLETERDTFKKGHEAIQGLQAYMAEAGLTVDEFNNTLAIAKLAKTKPEDALKALIPLVQSLQQQTGEVLPQDLQADVDQGLITRDRARELTLARNREQSTEAEREREAATAQQRSVEAVVGGISEWERQWSASDPDYQMLQPRVLRELKLELYEKGFPKSPGEVVEIANAVRDRVRKETKPASNLTPKNPVTSDGSTKQPVAAEPKSLIEAIALAAASR